MDLAGRRSCAISPAAWRSLDKGKSNFEDDMSVHVSVSAFLGLRIVLQKFSLLPIFVMQWQHPMIIVASAISQTDHHDAETDLARPPVKKKKQERCQKEEAKHNFPCGAVQPDCFLQIYIPFGHQLRRFHSLTGKGKVQGTLKDSY